MSRRERPTLASLRKKVHKDRHKEVGNWLARRWARPAAVYGTWLAVRVGLTAHQVTLLALGAGVGSAVAVGTGTRSGFIAGVALGHFAFWLDRVDGQVARWRGSASLDGVYLDYLMHHAADLALGFALGHGLALRTGQPWWSVAGFAVAFGRAGLSLHNDCRYKAFFERLKRGSRAYRIDPVPGGTAGPPGGPPRRGLGRLTWPAYKACEAHVVLLWLTALAVLAAVTPGAWLIGWKATVSGLAVLAPLLAVGRAGRAIRRGSVEDEFGRWFRPDPS